MPSCISISAYECPFDSYGQMFGATQRAKNVRTACMQTRVAMRLRDKLVELGGAAVNDVKPAFKQRHPQIFIAE